MKKRLLAVLLACSMVMGLAACGSTAAAPAAAPAAEEKEEAAPAEAEAEEEVKEEAEAAVEEAAEQAGEEKDLSDIQIAYVSGLLTNEIFAMQVEAMQKYADEIGVTFLNTPCADDAAKISACENYIQAGVDVIICHVSTVAAMTDSMKQAQAAGIKFFAYDTPIDGCDAFFGWDNYDYGWSIGMNAVNWINEHFTEDETCYCYSVNYPSMDFLVIRESGYIDAINENAKCKIEWAGEGLGGSTVNGVTTGENWLQNGKEINLVVGINDAGALGVLEAFNADGRFAGNDKVAIFAGDATSDAINAMQKEGSLYKGTVLTGLVNYAGQFIDIAVNLAQGKEEHYYYGGLWFITPENVAAYAASNDPADLDQYADYYIKDPE